MAIDNKELISAIEDGTKTLKKDFEGKMSEQSGKFQKQVEDVIESLKGLSSKEEVEAQVKASKETMQKQFDELATLKKDAKKPVGFKQAMANSIKENYEGINSVDKIKGNKVIQMKDISYDGNFDGFDDWRQDLRDERIPFDRDMFHVRNIIPLGSTSGDTIKYPRELAKTGTGPGPWQRGADIENTAGKPEFEPNMETYTTSVEWIAGIMRIPVEMLMDLPFLTSYLQNFAQIELLEAEDNQLLNGNGTSPQLDGLITNATAYNGSYTDKIGILVDAAYGQLAEAYHAPTNLLLNPRDFVDIILNKASGSGEYDTPNGLVGIVNGQIQMAGLTINKTTKIDSGDFLVGDFRKAQLIQRMAPQLRFFEQDRDNVEKNLVTVRIEERLALAIFKTNAFITGSFAATT